MPRSSYQNAELWIAELKAAGWQQVTLVIWRAPGGGLYRGPFAAWLEMKKTQPAAPDGKRAAAGDE